MTKFSPMKDLGGYIKPKDAQAMLTLAKSEGKDRDYILLKILWTTGRRISEVLNLKAKDIEQDDPYAIFKILKKRNKNYHRRMPLYSETHKEILWYIEEREYGPEDYLFPITRQRAWQIVREYAERIGVYFIGNTKPHPHHFRHGFAVAYAKENKGAEGLKNLQLLLDHSSVDNTMHYLQFAQEDTQRSIEKVFDKD